MYVHIAGVTERLGFSPFASFIPWLSLSAALFFLPPSISEIARAMMRNCGSPARLWPMSSWVLITTFPHPWLEGWCWFYWEWTLCSQRWANMGMAAGPSVFQQWKDNVHQETSNLGIPRPELGSVYMTINQGNSAAEPVLSSVSP